MSFRLGLTGSIGMGKSTTAQMFVDEGCALWDADSAVHRLYSKGGAAVEGMRTLAPDAIVEGAVSRAHLKKLIAEDKGLLSQIEQLVHPLVAKDREQFSRECSADIAVFDIPLLFENNTQDSMDAVVCVSTDQQTQGERVLARGTMTPEQFELILSRQMPDEKKRKLADYVVETDDMETARTQVRMIVKDIRLNLSQGAENA